MLKQGTRVTIRPTPPGVRASYPAANWIRPGVDVQVRLLEDAPHTGTVDVVDVAPVDPYDLRENLSVYDFNIVRGHRS